jgi:hypothetical protein
MFSWHKHFSKKVSQNDKKQTRNCKRTSFSASEKGVMTVEAAILIPLFLMVLLMISSVGEILMIHGQVAHGLKEAACQAAVSEYALAKKGQMAKGVSKGIAKSVFLASVNRKFLDRSSLSGGSMGVALTSSLVMNGKGEYIVTATYHIRKKMPFLLPAYGVFTQKIRQKAMTGYVPDQDEKKEGMVYVTPHESVYHTDLSCSHLSLHISADGDVKKYVDGKTRYRECEKCTRYHKGQIACLYIAEEGDAYHTDLSCSGLKRTVSQVDKSTLKGVKPCERCGN